MPMSTVARSGEAARPPTRLAPGTMRVAASAMPGDRLGGKLSQGLRKHSLRDGWYTCSEVT
jgi:hypothetical protein